MDVIRVCSGCGFENSATMRYCGNCARLLNGASGLAPQSVADPHHLSQSFENQVELETARRFQQAGLASVAQRRKVSILFADLSRYTQLSELLDQDALYELLQDVIKRLVDCVYLYEGIVDKIMGDGIMAMFGAPVSLENHAERAVRSALDMRAQVKQIGRDRKGRLDIDLNLHIGLNEGIVIIGGIGSDQRMDYTAIGETVNLASRLVETAREGEILVSESIFLSTKSLFTYTKPSRVHLKGYQQPVLAYRFLEEKAKPGSPRGLEGLAAPMVGRQREIGSLCASVESLIRSRQSQIVLVTGEAGIGKSRLKEEFRKQLQIKQLLVIEGQSLTYRRSIPYWIFRSLLLDLLELRPNAKPQIIRDQLSRYVATRLGSQLDDVLPFLEHLLLQEQDDGKANDKLAYLEPEQIRERIFQSVRDLLVAEARQQPVVIILEDLHWADDTSLELLQYLVESVHQAPIMLCAIARSDLAVKLVEISNLAEESNNTVFHHVQLNSLSPVQSEQLFSELLKIPEFPEFFRQLVLKRAEGIPYYLEEILRMLIDEGVIEAQDGRWRMSSTAEIPELRVPGNLQNLILARIDKLGPDHRSVLQAASVIGTEFSLPILSRVIPEYAEGDLRGILEYLTERAFILPPAETGVGFQFRHALTSDGVYGTLLTREKKSLHGRVAEAIESQFVGNLDAQVEILAGHYLRSANQAKALHYLILAGQKAAREYANQQSLRNFSEAAALLPQVQHTSEQARQIWTGIGDVLTFMGDYAEARQKYRAALDVCAGMVNPEDGLLVFRECSCLHRKLAVTFERQGEYAQAIHHLEAGSHLLDQAIIPSPYEKASILNAIGWIFFLQGKFDEARAALSAALKLMEGSKHFDVLASIHNRLGAVAYQEHSYVESEMHVTESLQLREQMKDKAGVARLYNNLGLLGLMRGNLRKAEENFLHSAALLGQTGDAEGIALSNINLGLVKIDRGDLEAAGTYLAKAIQAAGQIGHRYYLALAKMYIGRIDTETGDYSAADRCLNESLAIFTELGATDGRLDSIYYLAENALTRQDLVEAIAYAVQMEEELKGSGKEMSVKAVQNGRVLRLQGKIDCLQRRFNDARIKLEESDRIFSQSSEKLESGRTFLELGLLACSQNSTSLAKGYLQRACLIFDQLGAERDLNKAKSELDRLKK